MKKVAITLALFGCIAISVSIVGGQSRSSRASNKSSVARSAMATEQSLNNEARRLAAEYWKKSLVRCGSSYFFYTDIRLFEFKDEPYFSFTGHIIRPRPLSRVDILNGVDPLPVEWKGETSVSFNISRMNTAYYGYGQTFWHGWGLWENGGGYSLKLQRVKGKWDGFGGERRITCSELAAWGFTAKPKALNRVSNRSKTQILRVDPCKELIPCGPNADLRQIKPDPLYLLVMVENGNEVFLNGEPEGTLNNLSRLTRKLSVLFRTREQQGNFRVGTREVETTVWIPTQIYRSRSYLAESDLQKIIRAVKAAGANPIKIVDGPPPILVLRPNRLPIPGIPKSESVKAIEDE